MLDFCISNGLRIPAQSCWATLRNLPNTALWSNHPQASTGALWVRVDALVIQPFYFAPAASMSTRATSGEPTSVKSGNVAALKKAISAH